LVLYLLFREFQNTEWNYQLIGIGSAGLIRYGIYPFLPKTYRNKHLGLLIANEGYWDLTSGEFVHWRDVIHIRLSKNIFYRNFILVDLASNGEKQISANRFFRLIRAINTALLGAPAFINTSNLDTCKERLLALMLLRKGQRRKPFNEL
jgi:hypothetical protein